jgi:hypothetical protein
VRVLGIEDPQKGAGQAVEKTYHQIGLRIRATVDPIGRAKVYSRRPAHETVAGGGRLKAIIPIPRTTAGARVHAYADP